MIGFAHILFVKLAVPSPETRSKDRSRVGIMLPGGAKLYFVLYYRGVEVETALGTYTRKT